MHTNLTFEEVQQDFEELNYDEAIDQVMSQQNCEVDDLEL